MLHLKLIDLSNNDLQVSAIYNLKNILLNPLTKWENLKLSNTQITDHMFSILL